MPAGNHGSCIYENKYPVQDDKHNYRDSLNARLIEGICHYCVRPERDSQHSGGLVWGLGGVLLLELFYST